jgi:hypothetical protein
MIPLGKLGTVEKGQHIGWYVIVEDDRENTGGYYIFFSEHPDYKDLDSGGKGYDNWVQREEDLERFFQDWIVKWHD